MSLLDEIAGLKSENLCSALLAHLTLRSPEVRAHLIRLISDRAPRGPIYVQRQFAVFCEHPTSTEGTEEDAPLKRGRVDLVVETDDAVIGIENKFNAPFQDGQPAGYVALLEQRAHDLAELRKEAFSHVLIVLAPLRRESEVRLCIAEQKLADAADFLSWEDLLGGLLALEPASPIDRFLIRELNDYAQAQIGSKMEIGRLLPHLRRNWAPRGSAIHREFLNTLIWSLLSDRVKGGGSYKTVSALGYCGFYLRPRHDGSSDNLWIGFYEKRDPPGAAALAICTKSTPNDPIELAMGAHTRAAVQSGWTDYGWSCAEIHFDTTPAWRDIKTWTDALAPLNALIERIAQQHALPR